MLAWKFQQLRLTDPPKDRDVHSHFRFLWDTYRVRPTNLEEVVLRRILLVGNSLPTHRERRSLPCRTASLREAVLGILPIRTGPSPPHSRASLLEVILDILRNNVRLEEVYHETVRGFA